jgi:hypothetical protein
VRKNFEHDRRMRATKQRRQRRPDLHYRGYLTGVLQVPE